MEKPPHPNTETDHYGVNEDDELKLQQQLQQEKQEEEEEDKNENEEDETDGEEDEDDDDDDEEEEAEPFESDEAARNARVLALQLYNAHRYEEAINAQYPIVRYFAKKYGPTSALCGLYFLDYGLSQLRLLQSKSSVEAALQPMDQEALEACFVNLDIARVCFQKEEMQSDDDDDAVVVAVLMHLAETHNAIAQLHVEREDFDGALREYESELLTYRQLQSDRPESVPAGRLMSALYGIADCYMKEGDFEAAEERFTLMLTEIAKLPPDTIAPALVEELRELRGDAAEMKGGKFRAIQESIQEHFAEAVAEAQPLAEEFYGAATSDNKRHPFVSSLPGEVEYSALSMPQSASHPVQWNEHSNSMSVSLFPPQTAHTTTTTTNGGAATATAAGGGDASNGSQPVQMVVARKKPKVAPSVDPLEPTTKRVRTES